MANAGRSGRVMIPTGAEKTVIAPGFTGNKAAIYRFFNSGKGEGGKIEIREEGATDAIAELEWKDSVDVIVKQTPIVAKALVEKAELVYDFIGME